MANTSTIKSLDELIIKAISTIRKSQKRASETCIYDSIKIFLENCDKPPTQSHLNKQRY